MLLIIILYNFDNTESRLSPITGSSRHELVHGSRQGGNVYHSSYGIADIYMMYTQYNIVHRTRR